MSRDWFQVSHILLTFNPIPYTTKQNNIFVYHFFIYFRDIQMTSDIEV